MSELFIPELCREPIFTESHVPLPPLLLSCSPLFSEALGKMKDVYEKNPQMGDPASLASQISQTSQNIERLRGELNKYEVIATTVLLRGFTLMRSSRLLGIFFF